MTIEPRDLYELRSAVPELGRPVLIQALDGFVDAGGARQLARGHLLAAGDSQVLATFDTDLLYDYRARRPTMLFVEDHWESYEPPSLELHLLHDDAGTPYLLLAGPEPDVMWERFVAAVLELVEQFGVRLTVGLNAIPMAVPHTRPVGVIAHSSRRELIAGHEPWVGSVQVPGSAGALLEHRLAERGHDAVGYAVHVPHYVAQSAYPAAAVQLISCVAQVSGLMVSVEALTEGADEARRLIDEQVASNIEVAEVVHALESQYDAFVAGRGLLADGSRLPTGDELGAELERFLAEQRRRDT